MPHDEIKPCCPRCGDFAFGLDTACKNEKCECHSPTDWRERLLEGLKKAWERKENNQYPVEGGYEWLESFIVEIEAAAIERTRSEDIAVVEGKKEEIKKGGRGIRAEHGVELLRKETKNKVLSDIASTLKSLRKEASTLTEEI